MKIPFIESVRTEIRLLGTPQIAVFGCNLYRPGGVAGIKYRPRLSAAGTRFAQEQLHKLRWIYRQGYRGLGGRSYSVLG